MMLQRTAFLLSLTIIFSAGLTSAQGDEYSGHLNEAHPSDQYTLELTAGESLLISAEATSGDLDANLRLQNPDGETIAQNDDRAEGNLDPVLGYTVEVSGTYTVIISRYDKQANSGDYRLTLETGDASLLSALDSLTSIALSGPAEIVDSEHFRIHYTTNGKDATNRDFATLVSEAMENAWTSEIEVLGWPAPPDDSGLGGDARMDVYLIDTLDRRGYGFLGQAVPLPAVGDNPNTPEIERFAAPSALRLENDFVETLGETDISIADLVRSTAAHEFHHAIQDGYDSSEPHTWYFEATAVWIETLVYPKIQAAARFVQDNYSFPEACFGQSRSWDSILRYGDWMFIQSLADAHGQDIVKRLWTNIAQYDGFEALEQTLNDVDDTVGEALARYRVQNLTRDYKFAAYFGDLTVRMSQNIDEIGRWPSLVGIQELGATYYGFHPPAGLYTITLSDADPALQAWAVGIRDQKAESFQLGQDGIISTEGYDDMYLIVFNGAYDDRVNDCNHQDYVLEVEEAGNELPAVIQDFWNARYFLPLGN